MRAPPLWFGAAAVVLAGSIWAVLCLVLARDGHAPSVTLVPIPRERYYLAQAAFVVPVLLAQWVLCASIATRSARALGGAGPFSATAGGLGVALALPLAALFLIPDLIAYTAFGFSALGALVRVTAPLSFVATLALATGVVRRVHALPAAKALVASAAGVLGQAVLGAVLLR